MSETRMTLFKDYMKTTGPQLIKFGIIGAGNTIFCFGLIFILKEFAGLDYRLANAISYAIGISISFFLNKFWTFKAKGTFWAEALLFILVCVIAYFIQFSFLIFFKEALHLHFYLAQLMAMGFYTLSNFLGHKYFTFPDADAKNSISLGLRKIPFVALFQDKYRARDSWFFITLGLIAAAIFFRFFYLTLKPTHHDEGVNGWFIIQIWERGFFDYNPENFHGPLYFLLIWLSELIFGKGLIALRVVGASLSVVNVWLVCRFKRFFKRGVFWAALFFVISPSMVFYGRYAIHETLLITLEILFLYGFFLFQDSRDKNEKQLSVILMIGAFFGTWATKETFVIFYLTIIIAVLLLRLYEKIILPAFLNRKPASNSKKKTKGKKARIKKSIIKGKVSQFFFKENEVEQQFLYKNKLTKNFYVFWILLFTILTCYLFAWAFYNPDGVRGMFTALMPWFKTGTQNKSGHEKAFDYYIKLFFEFEWAVLPLFIGIVPVFFRGGNKMRFMALMAGGLFMAYSLIPYKTPWLNMTMLIPIAFVVGITLQKLIDLFKDKRRYIFIALACLLMAAQAGRMISLTFFRYDHHQEKYIYTHSYRDISHMMDLLYAAEEKRPEIRDMKIYIAIVQTWPLPWLFGDWPNHHYITKYEHLSDFSGGLYLVDIANEDQFEASINERYIKLTGGLRDAYTAVNFYFKASLFEDIWFGPGEIVGKKRISNSGGAQ